MLVSSGGRPGGAWAPPVQGVSGRHVSGLELEGEHLLYSWSWGKSGECINKSFVDADGRVQ